MTRRRALLLRRAARTALAAALVSSGHPPDACAQGRAAHGEVQASSGWLWSWDASAFLGWNYQDREFRDFQKIESQNWLMGTGERQALSGKLRLLGMLSFEPFTIQKLGSPQVFQTGETYQRAPLIDYQHPHDLFMALGAHYSRTVRNTNIFFELDAVGSPSIGPEPFMHRPSAANNPQVPLSHHQMDATHITSGVVKGGIERAGFGLDASWFRGQEPDENRKDIDFGRLDSWAVRGTWRSGGWRAQLSGAHLTKPEYVEPYSDITRLTASLGYASADGTRAALAAWGQNREIHGRLDAYLVEATSRLGERNDGFVRAELVTKDILGAGGRHPKGFVHFHPLSRVGAFTVGYVREISASAAGRFGVGADVTAYHVPANLETNYGSPFSFHIFLRYRPRASTMSAGHHH